MNTLTTSHSNDEGPFSLAERAAKRIQAEQCARTYLDRLNAGMAQPDELAAMLAHQRPDFLHGACRLIEKALEGRRHG